MAEKNKTTKTRGGQTVSEEPVGEVQHPKATRSQRGALKEQAAIVSEVKAQDSEEPPAGVATSPAAKKAETVEGAAASPAPEQGGKLFEILSSVAGEALQVGSPEAQGVKMTENRVEGKEGDTGPEDAVSAKPAGGDSLVEPASGPEVAEVQVGSEGSKEEKAETEQSMVGANGLLDGPNGEEGEAPVTEIGGGKGKESCESKAEPVEANGEVNGGVEAGAKPSAPLGPSTAVEPGVAMVDAAAEPPVVVAAVVKEESASVKEESTVVLVAPPEGGTSSAETVVAVAEAVVSKELVAPDAAEVVTVTAAAVVELAPPTPPVVGQSGSAAGADSDRSIQGEPAAEDGTAAAAAPPLVAVAGMAAATVPAVAATDTGGEGSFMEALQDAIQPLSGGVLLNGTAGDTAMPDIAAVGEGVSGSVQELELHAEAAGGSVQEEQHHFAAELMAAPMQNDEEEEDIDILDVDEEEEAKVKEAMGVGVGVGVAGEEYNPEDGLGGLEPEYGANGMGQMGGGSSLEHGGAGDEAMLEEGKPGGMDAEDDGEEGGDSKDERKPMMALRHKRKLEDEQHPGVAGDVEASQRRTRQRTARPPPQKKKRAEASDEAQLSSLTIDIDQLHAEALADAEDAAAVAAGEGGGEPPAAAAKLRRAKMASVSNTSPTGSPGGKTPLQKKKLDESLVRFSIKAFNVPELTIAMPDTASISALKKAVMDAAMNLLGGGLRVRVLLQGKRMQDEATTLAQAGISRAALGTKPSDALTFTLEPLPLGASPSLDPDPLLVLSPPPQYPPPASAYGAAAQAAYARGRGKVKGKGTMEGIPLGYVGPESLGGGMYGDPSKTRSGGGLGPVSGGMRGGKAPLSPPAPAPSPHTTRVAAAQALAAIRAQAEANQRSMKMDSELMGLGGGAGGGGDGGSPEPLDAGTGAIILHPSVHPGELQAVGGGGSMALVPHYKRPSNMALVSTENRRRIRRPFTVSEVASLVEAVEQLGTGRWRDVKLRAFSTSKHRTYVDLKDKWKTLVHTAQIAPHQRRGEPVPQELLDRVVRAHAYWTEQLRREQMEREN